MLPPTVSRIHTLTHRQKLEVAQKEAHTSWLTIVPSGREAHGDAGGCDSLAASIRLPVCRPPALSSALLKTTTSIFCFAFLSNAYTPVRRHLPCRLSHLVLLIDVVVRRRRRGANGGDKRDETCSASRRFTPSWGSSRMSRAARLPTRSPIVGLFQLIVFLAANMPGTSAIGCFVCSSFDGDNKACEDPFNSTMDASMRERESSSVPNYNHPCWAHKKGRNGLFPADHCIKIIGYRSDNESKTLVIRTCALDSGTLTADTEIVRISHCGSFKYEGHQYKGCVQSCDSDGCNRAPNVSPIGFLLAVFAFICTLRLPV
ncbi:unnamed protein product [Caenorhabditis auriculariae]|uniref:Protein sleepless n=1 Tax=Caenorhabditis auriculariae TaxID=2777116 RepID=A0A8S1H5R1_9PELO|nr:unnamed protein product [Caenorhabditis auriculariae]